MLLLHIMQDVLSDPDSYMMKTISSLEQQQIREESSLAADNGVPDNSGESSNNYSMMSASSVEERTPPVPDLSSVKKPPAQLSTKKKALEALVANSRYGIIGGEDVSSLSSKRSRTPVIKYGTTRIDGGEDDMVVGLLPAEEGPARKKSKDSKAPAEQTSVNVKVEKQQTTTKTKKKTTKPTNVPTGRRKKEAKVTFEPEELVESEEDEEVEEEVVVQYPRRGGRRGAREVLTTSSSQKNTTTTDSSTVVLLEAQQRLHEKQIAQLKADNEKMLKAQSKAIEAAIMTKITADLQEAKNTKQQQAGRR